MARKKPTVVVIGEEELVRKLQALQDAAKEELLPAGLLAAEVVRAEAERLAPGPHIHVANVNNPNPLIVDFAIGPDREHWYYVIFETGAQPHEIPRANRKGKKMLHFQGDQGEIFTLAVDHPGMPATPFLRPAMDTKKDEARDAARDFLRQSIYGIARS